MSKFGNFKKKQYKFKNSNLDMSFDIGNLIFNKVFTSNDLNDEVLPSLNKYNVIFTTKNRDLSGLMKNANNIIFFQSMIGLRQSEILKNSNGVVGNYFAKHKRKQRDNLKGSIKERLSHAKIIAFIKNGNYYVTFSSANLDNNARFEYHIILNDKNTYEFIKKAYNNV